MHKAVLYVKERPIVFGLLPLLVFIGAGFTFFGDGDLDFQTIAVKKGDFVEVVSVSGTVVAEKNVELGFSQSGRVSGVYVQSGDRVAQGALLSQIENGDIRAMVAQKQAALQSAKAQLAKLHAGTRPERLEADRDALVQAVAGAYVNADDAVHNKADQFITNPRTITPQLSFTVSDSNRAVRFLSTRVELETMLANWQRLGLASLSTAELIAQASAIQLNLSKTAAFLDDANALLANAAFSSNLPPATISSYQSGIATARSNLSASLTDVTTDKGTLSVARAGSTKEDIETQEAAVASAQADLMSAQAQFQKTLITAPFSGTIATMDAKVGQIASSNVSVISMISNGSFQIETYIPEVHIAKVAVGNPATTTLDAYGLSAHFKAKVISIAPAQTMRDGVSTYKTVLQFLAPDPRIRAGMTADVDITTRMIPNAIAIPQGAVFEHSGYFFVQVLKDGKLIEKLVVKGESSSLGLVEIRSGLTEGEVLVLNP